MSDSTSLDCPDDFEQLLGADVVTRVCGNCGTETIMNAVFAKYVPGDLMSCRQCRNPSER